MAHALELDDAAAADTLGVLIDGRCAADGIALTLEGNPVIAQARRGIEDEGAFFVGVISQTGAWT
jgi:hypothetical protein